jgi:hypothetical protein
MPGNIQAVGKRFVATEPGDALSIRGFVSNKILLDNGQRVQIKRAGSNGTAIAQSQTDSEIIPAVAGFYLVVFSYTLMADANTAVSLGSKLGADTTAVISGPWPLLARGAFVNPDKGRPYFRCEAGAALVMTTGAGGNTSFEIDYAEVPLDVDIL